MQGRHLLAGMLALALVMAACGDDDGGTTAPAATGPTTTAVTTVPTDTTIEPERPCVLWYTDFSNGTLTKYDLCAAECMGTTQIGASATLVDIAFGSVWVVECLHSQLVRVDVNTNEVTGRVNIPGCPSDMLLADSSIWLALPDLPGLMEIDPYTGETISTILTDDPPLSLHIGSLWIGFPSMLAWTTKAVQGVGDATLDSFDTQSIPTAGPVRSIDGDPIYVEGIPAAEGGDEMSRINSIDDAGSVAHLAELPGEYKSALLLDDYFIAIAPYANNVHVGMADGSAGTDIPVHEPYAMEKGRDGGSDDPPGSPPGVRPPIGPAGGPGQPVVVANKACDVWFWPGASHDELASQGNCQCEWVHGSALTDITAATYSRVAAEIAFAATLDAAGFPMAEPEAQPGQAAGGPRCSSVGYRLQDDGRTIVDPFSVWEEDGVPVDRLEVELFLSFGDWHYPLYSALTGEDGKVTFAGEYNLDEIEGAPPPGSTLTIGQAPVIDGVVRQDIACESDADV
ncbi:MAG: hypothetical protein ABIJ75_06810 [Actinomycetota bacterium]